MLPNDHIQLFTISFIKETFSNLTSLYKQECIPVGCVPPAAVAIRGSPPGTPLDQTPLEPGIPPGADPPPPGAGTPQTRQSPRAGIPWTRHPTVPGTPPDQAPPDQAPPCGQTHDCKHITLPQTSFAGGNKVNLLH